MEKYFRGLGLTIILMCCFCDGVNAAGCSCHQSNCSKDVCGCIDNCLTTDCMTTCAKQDSKDCKDWVQKYIDNCDITYKLPHVR